MFVKKSGGPLRPKREDTQVWPGNDYPPSHEGQWSRRVGCPYPGQWHYGGWDTVIFGMDEKFPWPNDPLAGKYISHYASQWLNSLSRAHYRHDSSCNRSARRWIVNGHVSTHYHLLLAHTLISKNSMTSYPTPLCCHEVRLLQNGLTLMNSE